ncbi:MAG TPA: dienelactone hydrolase family protein [Burkholderiales bacterium]|nr:dienelactone hydrolase family protein [Burkholderiales bacterium]
MDPRTIPTPEAVSIQAGAVKLHGLLRLPLDASSIILFAHGSGSGRLSPRNTFVAEHLRQAGIATLLLDLLTGKEEEVDAVTAELRFNIPLLTTRLAAATEWALQQPRLRGLAVGYFGASTGAAAALAAAAEMPEVTAVVSRGGRPDLAGAALLRVRAATLLIVGSNDPQVLGLNRDALRQLHCEKELAVVPGATHLFVEPGALEQVTTLATAWFTLHARPRGAASPAVSGPE